MPPVVLKHKYCSKDYRLIPLNTIIYSFLGGKALWSVLRNVVKINTRHCFFLNKILQRIGVYFKLELFFTEITLFWYYLFLGTGDGLDRES